MNNNKSQLPNIRIFLSNLGWISIFIGPSVLVMILVLVVPLIGALYLSTQNYIDKELQFVGLTNYQKILIDQDTWNAFRTNVIFTAISVSLSLLTGFYLALLLDQQKWGRRFFRTIFMTPWPFLYSG